MLTAAAIGRNDTSRRLPHAVRNFPLSAHGEDIDVYDQQCCS